MERELPEGMTNEEFLRLVNRFWELSKQRKTEQNSLESLRSFKVTTLDSKEFPESIGQGWQGILGDRQLERATIWEFDLGEEVIGFLEFQDGTCEVGIGEFLRPYDKVYLGEPVEGLKKFLEVCLKHTLVS